MSAVILFAFALLASPQAGQSAPARAPATASPDCASAAGRQGEPVCPGPSHPIPIPYPSTGRGAHPTVTTGPIRASNGDEAGTARREVAPQTAPGPETGPAALTGRPVGQPAAAGLGSHVQREAPPAGPQPQNHEIKAVTGNEGGHPHTGGTADIPMPKPSVQFRGAAPTPPTSPAAPAPPARAPD